VASIRIAYGGELFIFINVDMTLGTITDISKVLMSNQVHDGMGVKRY